MQKAKLLRNIGIALLPVMLYFCVFIAFEPNNYFGLKASADGTDIMATLRQYQRHPQNRIILGDSRLAKLDPVAVQEASGRFYSNLAFGGASLKEQLDVLDWAMERNTQLNEVVFMLSFYTLNQAYNQDRKIIAAMNNPLRYMTNLGYNINMLTNLTDHLLPGRQVGSGGETQTANDAMVDFTNPATGETIAMRKPLADHLKGLSGRSSQWQLNDTQFHRLLKTIETCQKKGIRITLVLPPATDEVMTFIVDQYGIRQPMEAVLATLAATGATLLDYEFDNRQLFAPEDFYDGFHLDEKRGLPRFTSTFFAAIAEGGS